LGIEGTGIAAKGPGGGKFSACLGFDELLVVVLDPANPGPNGAGKCLMVDLFCSILAKLW
jgi:hypothetical protein